MFLKIHVFYCGVYLATLLNSLTNCNLQFKEMSIASAHHSVFPV